MREPLSPGRVKAIARACLAAGKVTFSRHAESEMLADGLAMTDCMNVIRGGRVMPGEYQAGSYRYEFQTQRISVVVAIRSLTEIRIITAWRVRG